MRKLEQLSAVQDSFPLTVNHIDVCVNSVQFDPEDSSEDQAFELMGGAVMQIRNNVNNPAFHKNRPCLICGHTGHSFAECPSMTANTPKTFETFGKLVSLLDGGHRMAQAHRKQVGSACNPMQPPQFPPPAAVPTQALSSAPVQDPSIQPVDAPALAPVQAVNSVGSHSASALTNPTVFSQTPVAQPMSCMSAHTAPLDWNVVTDPATDSDSDDTDNEQHFGWARC